MLPVVSLATWEKHLLLAFLPAATWGECLQKVHSTIECCQNLTTVAQIQRFHHPDLVCELEIADPCINAFTFLAHHHLTMKTEFQKSSELEEDPFTFYINCVILTVFQHKEAVQTEKIGSTLLTLLLAG